MPNKKRPIEELVEKSKDFRNATVVQLREKLYKQLDPEVDKYLMKTLEEEANKSRKIEEMRGDLEDDLENPIPENDEFEEEEGFGDDLPVEGGEELPPVEDEAPSEEIGTPPPSAEELDSGDVEILQIKVNGREYEAEVGQDDNEIIFKAVDAPLEGGEEDAAVMGDGVGDEEQELEFEEEDEFNIGGEGEDNIDINIEDEDEFDEEEELLKREVLNRIAAKRKSGLSNEEILKEYREKIREKLAEKLSTNIHGTKEKPKKKVTIEEHLKNRNLVPEKFNKEVLTESEEKQIYDRFADLCNL